MKLRPLPLGLISFGMAFGLALAWKSVDPEVLLSFSAEARETVPGSTSPLAVSAAAALPPTSADPAMPELLFSKSEEDRLLELCRSLIESDPEAAFRAGLMRWGFDTQSMASAAAALVKKDPAAAGRLLAECPDLRSKIILEGELRAAEVSRDPEEKLRWAEANLQGYVRIRAMNAGIHALAALNPSAALEILAEWPPSNMKAGGQFKALGARLKEDAAAALAWVGENVHASEREFTGVQACLNFLKLNPTEGLAILAALSPEFQEHMGFAMVWASGKGPEGTSDARMEILRSLPAELHVPVIREWMTNLGHEEASAQYQFLSGFSDPAERAAAVESLAVSQLSSYNDANKEAILESLSRFKTSADKQSFARVVPHISHLSETQRAELLARLQ